MGEISLAKVEPNVFERTGLGMETKVLFIVFGGLSDIVNAFPRDAAALRERLHSETVWLDIAGILRRWPHASFADAVREAEPRGSHPAWDFGLPRRASRTSFFPEPGANQEEWEQSGLHPIDFMAKKCGVEVETRQSWLEPSADALFGSRRILTPERPFAREGLSPHLNDGSQGRSTGPIPIS